jgi:CBS-domain-containing membrane protein
MMGHVGKVRKRANPRHFTDTLTDHGTRDPLVRLLTQMSHRRVVDALTRSFETVDQP